MAGLQHDDDPVIQDFHTWRKETGQIGIGIAEDKRVERTFIPYSCVDAYLNEDDRVESLLRAIFPDADPGKLPDADTIRKNHLRNLCILLSISKGRFITNFIEYELIDSKLPHEDRPRHFPVDSGDIKFWNSFFERQWEFSAREFTCGIGLHIDAKEWILPIIEMEEIGDGGSAVIYKIKLHDDYDSLQQHVSLTRHLLPFIAYSTQIAFRYIQFSHLRSKDVSQNWSSHVF